MEAEVVKAKRLGWVWVIAIFFFISVGWTLLSFFLIRIGAVPLSAAQIAYFESLTALDYISSIGIGLANLAGAIALFMLRRAAFYIFACSIGANLLLTVWHMTAKGWVAAMSGGGLVGAAIGFGLLFAVCWYSRRLLQRGVLR